MSREGGEKKELGRTASSFGINYGYCMNNGNYRKSENWSDIVTNFSLGLWFDVSTRNIIIYFNTLDREDKKIPYSNRTTIAFKGCKMDATKVWVLAVQLNSRTNISVLKNASHSEPVKKT